MKANDSWEPIYGEAIGPTPSDRIRSGVGLGAVLVFLGVAVAAGLVLSVVIVLGLAGAAAG